MNQIEKKIQKKVEHFPLDIAKLNEDAKWYADRIKSGKQTTTIKDIEEQIESDKKDLFLLEIGRIKPSQIIGTGYKGNTKKIANTYLLEQIYRQTKTLELLQDNFASGGVTENYVSRKELNTITIKKGNQKLTYKISDVLNGAYKLESGAKLEDIAFYVPKRNIVKVQLKTGKDFKPANGYWIKDGAKPIHVTKFMNGGYAEDGAEIDEWEKYQIQDKNGYVSYFDDKNYAKKFLKENEGSTIVRWDDDEETEWLDKYNESLESRGFADGGMLGKEIIFMRHGVKGEGIIGQINADGSYGVDTGYSVKLVEPNDILEVKQSKRRSWFFEEGGNVPSKQFVVINEKQIIAEFDDEEEAKDFIYEYELENPRVNLELKNMELIPKFQSSYIPDNKLPLNEWMMKHNSSPEARIYDNGGVTTFEEKATKMSGGFYLKNGYFKNEIDNDYIEEINKYYNKWNSIKDEKDSENFKKTKPPMFGTYQQTDILNQINHFEKLDIPFQANEISRNQFKKEVGKIISKFYESKAEKGAVVKKGKGNHKMKEVTELAKKIRKDGEKWQDALKRAYQEMK